MKKFVVAGMLCLAAVAGAGQSANATSILGWQIGGKAAALPHEIIPLDTPQPSSEVFTPAQIATGAKFYGAYCTICHGGPVNPDLRRSALLQSKDAFRQVVIGGSLSQNGMASFAAYMKPADAEGIRAYLNGQAQALLAEERKKTAR